MSKEEEIKIEGLNTLANMIYLIPVCLNAIVSDMLADLEDGLDERKLLRHEVKMNMNATFKALERCTYNASHSFKEFSSEYLTEVGLSFCRHIQPDLDAVQEVIDKEMNAALPEGTDSWPLRHILTITLVCGLSLESEKDMASTFAKISKLRSDLVKNKLLEHTSVTKTWKCCKQLQDSIVKLYERTVDPIDEIDVSEIQERLKTLLLKVTDTDFMGEVFDSVNQNKKQS